MVGDEKKNLGNHDVAESRVAEQLWVPGRQQRPFCCSSPSPGAGAALPPPTNRNTWGRVCRQASNAATCSCKGGRGKEGQEAHV